MENPFLDRCRFPEQRVLQETSACLLLYSPQASVRGSVLIVPKERRETPFDLTETEWNQTRDLLLVAKQHLMQHQPDGFNIGWNCKPCAGQSIPWAHPHVIPRFADEVYAGHGIRWHIKQLDNQRQPTHALIDRNSAKPADLAGTNVANATKADPAVDPAVRAADVGDAQTLLELLREFAAFDGRLDRLEANIRNLRAVLQQVDPPIHFILAEPNGSPAGFASFSYTYSSALTQPCLQLEDLHVRSPSRRRGGGSIPDALRGPGRRSSRLRKDRLAR